MFESLEWGRVPCIARVRHFFFTAQAKREESRTHGSLSLTFVSHRNSVSLRDSLCICPQCTCGPFTNANSPPVFDAKTPGSASLRPPHISRTKSQSCQRSQGGESIISKILTFAVVTSYPRHAPGPQPASRTLLCVTPRQIECPQNSLAGANRHIHTARTHTRPAKLTTGQTTKSTTDHSCLRDQISKPRAAVPLISSTTTPKKTLAVRAHGFRKVIESELQLSPVSCSAINSHKINLIASISNISTSTRTHTLLANTEALKDLLISRERHAPRSLLCLCTSLPSVAQSPFSRLSVTVKPSAKLPSCQERFFSALPCRALSVQFCCCLFLVTARLPRHVLLSSLSRSSPSQEIVNVQVALYHPFLSRDTHPFFSSLCCLFPLIGFYLWSGQLRGSASFDLRNDCRFLL